MGILTTIINAFVVLAVGAFLTWVTIDRYRQLRRDLEARMAEQSAKIAEQAAATVRLETRIDGAAAMLQDRIDGAAAALQDRMERSVHSLRSDLTAIALAVETPPRPRPA